MLRIYLFQSSSPVSRSRSNAETYLRLQLLILILLFVPGFCLAVGDIGGGLDKSESMDRRKAIAQLEQLRQKIIILNKNLAAKRKQHSTVLHELNIIETRLSLVSRKLTENSNKQKVHTAKLKKLKQRQTGARRNLRKNLNLLSEETRIAFFQGRQSTLKILLSNNTHTQVQRGLVYHRYIQKYRQQGIARVEKQLKALEKISASIRQRTMVLSALRQNYKSRQSEYAAQRQQRRKLITALNSTMKQQQSRLKAHESSRRELQSVLKVITRTISHLPVTQMVFKTFPSLKGSMSWPVKGKIVSHFGKRRASSNLHARGVLIRTVPGTKVTAISHGRVAYADWLRGFGLIIIVDHGTQYLSLYGHNQTLYKEVGDWVKAGEVIAATGDSGGIAHSGLYFEIRRRGIPQNPAKWCRKLAKRN